LLALLQRFRRDMFERRDKEWERRLPPAYRPLDHYAGTVNTEWQERWATNRGRIQDENLANEKSHMAITLAPLSERTKYGLDLTRGLLKRMEDVTDSHMAKLVVFQADAGGLPEQDEMHVLNGKYYLVSKKQFVANWRYINQGFQTEIIPVTVDDWRVSPDDAHLNQHANEQVMAALANRVSGQIRQ
jgi:hypothetical protein